MNINELKVLMALHGGTRIEYLESEIFASEELYTFYVETIVACTGWFYDGSPEDFAWITYICACNLVKGRWHVAEKIIAKDPESACNYAEDIIGGRWTEAESVIAEYTAWAFYYTRDVMGSRWPEAEAAIAKEGKFAEWYNERYGTDI